jgi:hypothetical protein
VVGWVAHSKLVGVATPLAVAAGGCSGLGQGGAPSRTVAPAADDLIVTFVISDSIPG